MGINIHEDRMISEGEQTYQERFGETLMNAQMRNYYQKRLDKALVNGKEDVVAQAKIKQFAKPNKDTI